MATSFKNIVAKLISEFKKFPARDRGGWSPRPERAWRIILGVFAIAVILAAIWSFYFYRRLTSLETPRGETKALKTINREELSRTLEYFSERQKIFDQYWQSPPKIVDPS